MSPQKTEVRQGLSKRSWIKCQTLPQRGRARWIGHLPNMEQKMIEKSLNV